MTRWIWFALAIVCGAVAFAFTPILVWHNYISVFLYMLSGALVWSHVVRNDSPRTRTRTPEELKEVDKEYR